MSDINREIVTKRFQTTMIGALYAFEETFGHLWGLEKYEDELTEAEYKFRLMWENTRNTVLNNGNNQLRKCLSDMDKSSGGQVKFNYNFKKRN